MRVSDVVLELALGASSTVKQGLALLHLPRQGSGLALADADLLNDLGTRAGLILKGLDGLTELVLDTESLALGPLLGLNGGSKGVHCTGMILPGVVELLLLLSHTAVDLLPDLSQLQLRPQNLVLLHLKGGFSFLKGSLQLLFLDLLPDLSQLQL